MGLMMGVVGERKGGGSMWDVGRIG
jgi:hypothetical protein